MKRRFGNFETLRAEEAGGASADGSGAGGSGSEDSAASTLKLDGKEVSMDKLRSALSLHDALSDETTGKEIIGTLAERMGLLRKDGELKDPKTAEAKLEGRVQRMLKTKFGKDYEKFADTLGPVMDEAIQEYLQEAIGNATANGEAVGWEGEVEKFTESHTLNAQIEQKMEQLITRNGGVPKGLRGKAAQEYLTDMYELAAHRLGVSPPEAERSSRRRSRSEDEIPEFREVARPKGPLSIDDIVEAASKGIRFRQ